MVQFLLMGGFAQRRILVVDDEPAIRSLVKFALSVPGHEVFDAENGVEALKLAVAHGPFALVVSDVVMPLMDGIQLVCELQERGLASAYLLMSGYCDENSIRSRSDRLSPCSFLAKPFTIPDLLRVVHSIVPEEAHRARGRSEQARERRSAAPGRSELW